MHFEWVNYMVYEFYLNKAVISKIIPSRTMPVTLASLQPDVQLLTFAVSPGGIWKSVEVLGCQRC